MANESIFTSIPENTNFLQGTQFIFTVPDMPYMNYFCQTALLPSLSLGEVMLENPFSATYRHGDKINFDPLTITALVDEDLMVYEETYKWMRALAYPHDFKEYFKNLPGSKPGYYDAILTFNTNAHVQNIRVKFKNCFPTSLGSIQLAATDTADIVPIVDITFRYDQFTFERL